MKYPISRIVRRGIVAVLTYALVMMFAVPPAAADDADTLNVTAGTVFRYDANIFRTPDSAGPQPGYSSKADIVMDSYVGLRVNKPYALQRFQFDITQNFTRYDTFSYLNNEALNYRAAWLWALTPHLTGSLSADRTQAQIPFAQIGGTQRNVRTTNNQGFNVDGWVSGAWHLLAGVGQTESTTEQAVLSLPSFRSHRAEAGVRYLSRADNSITFMQRWIPTELVNQPLDRVNLIDSNYRDLESELKVFWKATGHSSFDASLSRKERRNDTLTQRDFSGFAGDLRYHWTPTGKLQFNFGAARNIVPYAAFGNTIENSTYRIDQTLSLGSVWQVDARVAVGLNLVRTVSDYAGPVFAITGPARSDDIRSAQLRADWSPLRYLSVNAGLAHEQRSSNDARFQFSDNILTVGAVLTF